MVNGASPGPAPAAQARASSSRSMAQAAGWNVTDERVTDSSVGLEDGRDWEIENAKHLAEDFMASKPPSVSDSALGAVAAEYALFVGHTRSGPLDGTGCGLERD